MPNLSLNWLNVINALIRSAGSGLIFASVKGFTSSFGKLSEAAVLKVQLALLFLIDNNFCV